MQNPYPGGPQFAPTPQKSSPLPWIIGGGCLLLALLGGGCVALFGVFAVAGSSEAPSVVTASPAVVAPAPVAPVANAPASGNRFVNAKQGLTGELDTNYTAFSVDYPKGWKLDDKARSKGTFLNVALNQDAGGGVSRDVAKVTISWWSVKNGGPKQLIEELKYEGRAKAISRAAKFGGRDGWEAVTSQESKLFNGKTETLLVTRIALPAQPGAKQGLFIIAFAVSGIGMGDKPEEVGTQGALNTVLDSLVIGSDVSAAALAAPCAISESENCLQCCGIFGHSQSAGSGNRCNCQ